MKIIVTGGTGYIGSNLIRRLIRENHKILLIVRPQSSLSLIKDVEEQLKIFIYHDELASLIECFKSYQADCVYHLASCFIAEHTSNQVNMLVEANLTFGLHILEAMKEAHIKTLVNTGTIWEYAYNAEYDPVCLYAATKKAFEDLAYFYHKAYDLRVFNCIIYDTYGPFDPRKKLFNFFKRASVANEPIGMSPGEQKLSLVYIDDVIMALFKVIDLFTNENNIFIHYAIRADKMVPLTEIVKLYERIFHVKLNIKWGAMPYHKRQIMNPCNTLSTVPNWSCITSLEEGMKKLKALEKK